MKQIRTAAIGTLGCKLNQSESDQMARQLAEIGIVIVPFDQRADLYIINSCTVTHIGDRKSRQLIRRAIHANPNAFVAVAGCYAEIEPAAVNAIEGVGAIIGNKGKSSLVDVLSAQGLTLGTGVGDGKGGREDEFESAEARDLVLSHKSSVQCSSTPHPPTPSPTPRTRAFVKIQEGCDNYCSYCIVPVARGHQRSRPAPDIFDEIRRLASEGCQEIVLTGVNITAYGRDHGLQNAWEFARGAGLITLLHSILSDTEVPRVRLSSLQPEDWNPRFYELWSTGRLCRQLHLSLQSGSDSVLRRMRRRYSTSQYARIVEEARREMPGVAITTDVITGFPGETEEEHRETVQFLRSVAFAGLHVFKFSPRTGTDAAAMAGQVDPATKQRRSDCLIAVADEMNRDFRRQFDGVALGVLWEEQVTTLQASALGLETGGGKISWSGISDNYVRVYASGPEGLQGTISGSRIGPIAGDGVIGTLNRP